MGFWRGAWEYLEVDIFCCPQTPPLTPKMKFVFEKTEFRLTVGGTIRRTVSGGGKAKAGALIRGLALQGGGGGGREGWGGNQVEKLLDWVLGPEKAWL